MQYPLISEYVRAMQDPAGNLDQLAHLVPVLDDHGEPMRSSGAFAVVFKMKDESTGKEYALKCFTEDQEGRAEAYRQIADELESVDSTYVTSAKYLEKELFVGSNCDDDEFPVLLMDWIEGETMDRYIAENLYDNYAMSMLCYRFCKMAAWLRSQPFAHGDIKPDNIMIRPDGSLTLIDYDGMFVPSMKGQTSPTIGTKDFSHPLRTKDDFDETIDDFALATIALSLKAISLSPSLFDEYGSTDRLLFSADDYRDLSQSKALPALQPLMKDSEINTLLYIFLLAYATKTLAMASFRLFSVSIPEYVPIKISSEVTYEDLAEVIEDEYGVKYSKDRKRLLKAPEHIKGEYHIRKGSVCICDYAFSGCSMLKNVVIPSSVTKIGYMAFGSMDESGEYFGRSGLTSIEIPGSVIEIGDSAFSHCDDIESVKISNGVTVIGKNAFSGCYGLTSIKIPDSVTEIGAYAFSWCTGLESIMIPNSVKKIWDGAFKGCTGLTSIALPDGLTEIGQCAFEGCTGLESITIPNSVTEIENYAFSGCDYLLESVKKELTAKYGHCIFEKSWNNFSAL
jgi:serine/threonine protein kinase